MGRGPLIGAALSIAAAASILAFQPVRDPWWHSADPDGAYVGSSLNIVLGNHTNYLDHPGLPTQDVLALAFGGEYLLKKATGGTDDRQSFASEKLLDLDSARPLYRTWALLVFFGATLLTYVVVQRLLGHWSWGVAGSVLFVSTPALAPIAYYLRPDAALAALCLAAGYLTATGFERRSALRYTAAAIVLGLALTVKIPAVGMVLPLAVAVAWRPPPRQWAGEALKDMRRRLRRNLWWLAPVALGWLVLCWVFNRERTPLVQTDDQRDILINGAVIIAGYGLLALIAERMRIPWADRIFRLFYAWLLVAFVLGIALPATLVLDDAIQMLVSIKQTLTGGRVNEGIEPFENFVLAPFLELPLAATAVVFALALVAGVAGLFERRFWPALMALGAVVLGTMAAARYSFDYYYAPAFAVSIPGALWLTHRVAGRAGHVVAMAAAVMFFTWTVIDSRGPGEPTGHEINAAAQALADELVQPGEVILVQSYYSPIEDVRFGSLVEDFVDYVPEYPYRFLAQPEIAAKHGLRLAYYVAPIAELPVSGRAEVSIGGHGPYLIETMRLRWGAENELGVAKIIEAPPPEESP